MSLSRQEPDEGKSREIVKNEELFHQSHEQTQETHDKLCVPSCVRTALYRLIPVQRFL